MWKLKLLLPRLYTPPWVWYWWNDVVIPDSAKNPKYYRQHFHFSPPQWVLFNHYFFYHLRRETWTESEIRNLGGIDRWFMKVKSWWIDNKKRGRI